MHAFLEHLSGPARGRRIPLDGAETILGRGADADVYVDNPARSISGRHAVVVRLEEGYEVRDESRNGTWWRARSRRSELSKIGDEPHRLTDREVLVLPGEVELRFHHPARPFESQRRRRAAAFFLALVLLACVLLVLAT